MVDFLEENTENPPLCDALRSCRLWRHRLAAILFYVPEDNVSRGKVIKRWYFPRNVSHLSSRNSSKKMTILSRRSIAWYTLLESKGSVCLDHHLCWAAVVCVKQQNSSRLGWIRQGTDQCYNFLEGRLIDNQKWYVLRHFMISVVKSLFFKTRLYFDKCGVSFWRRDRKITN